VKQGQTSWRSGQAAYGVNIERVRLFHSRLNLWKMEQTM